MATLGEPIGTIELREKTLLLYPQGEITLRNDKVIEIDLMSQAQFEADQKRLAVEREEWLAAQEKLAAARVVEGKAVRAEKMASSSFAAQPAKDRLAYWRKFQANYPEVDASEQITSTMASYESELETLLQEQRIAELEARVAQAETDAATARLETEKLREESEQQAQKTYYGLRSYTDPIINTNRYYYRPPTVTIYTSGNGKNIVHRKNDNDREEQKPPKKTPDPSKQRNERPETAAELAARIMREARSQ
jgi:hypothetical protein